MEMELLQMRSFNRAVYESRVRQAFLDEQVTRALYMQSLATRRHERLQAQRLKTAERMRRETTLCTPFLQQKMAAKRAVAEEEHRRGQTAPRFEDLENIDRYLNEARLASRGVMRSDANLTRPATVEELASRANQAAPPVHALLHPRNQVTSPLPPKNVLLPRAFAAARDDR